MKYEESFGIIPLKRGSDGSWQVFLIQHRSGGAYWGFPKGHPEDGETPQESAARELEEETHLKISRIFSDEPLEESYFFERNGDKISKKVQYFLAEVEGTVLLQKKEILNGKWVDIDTAPLLMVHSEGKKLCKQIKEFLDANEFV